MQSILVAGNVMDTIFKQMVGQLAALGWQCRVAPLPGQDFRGEFTGIAAEIVDDFAVAAAESPLVYLAIDAHHDLGPLNRLDLAPLRGRLIVDLARCSLNLKRDSEKELRARHDLNGHWLVARDECQLIDADGNPLAAEVLLCTDYLQWSFQPRHAFDDLLWFMHRAQGYHGLTKPPSAYLELLASADAGDQTAEAVARDILALDPMNIYACLRLALPDIIQKGTMPAELDNLLKQDPLGWVACLWLRRYLPPGSPLAGKLDQVKDQTMPGPARGEQDGKKILLFVMRKQRDLFVDLVLRYWLEQAGHQVVMRPIGDSPENAIAEVLPDAIIWGGPTTQYKVNLARFARQRNIFSIVRREEVGYSIESWNKRTPTEKQWWVGNWDYSPLVDFEIFQHPDCAEFTSDEGHMPRELTDSVGSLVLAPYHLPSLKKWFPPKQEFCGRLGISPDKKVMLLATRWTYADRDPRTAVPEALNEKGRPANQVPEVAERIEQCLEGRRVWLDLAQRLYRDYGQEFNIVLKVHPGEKPDEYQQVFGEAGMNIPVILEDYMVEVLNYVDLLLHAGSTTAMEAHHMGIPSLNYKDPNPEALPISRLVPRATDYGQLQQLIAQTTLGISNADPAMVELLERDFYGSIDGGACQRCAALIDRLLRGVATRPLRFPSDQSTPGQRTNIDPYGQNITDQDVAHYYRIVKGALDNGPDMARDLI